MATFHRRGYLVCLWPNPYERVLVVTEHAPLWLERRLYNALDDDQFEQFMTEWLAGDYAQSCIALGESDPRDGLKHLAEANEREKAAKAKFATDMDRLRTTDPGGAQWVEQILAERPERRPEPDTLPELVSRMREHGLNEAADFFSSVGPVAARDRVISRGAGKLERIPSRGNVYNDPDDTPWPTPGREPWRPCADCLDPDLCEKSVTELCS